MAGMAQRDRAGDRLREPKTEEPARTGRSVVAALAPCRGETGAGEGPARSPTDSSGSIVDAVRVKIAPLELLAQDLHDKSPRPSGPSKNSRGSRFWPRRFM